MAGSIRSRYGIAMHRIIRYVGTATVIAVLAGGVLALRGYVEACSDPVVRSARLVPPDWPAGAAPVRVALLSDIHIGNAVMDASRLTRIVAQVNARRPDLILLDGDFVVGHDRRSGAGLAARLTRPLASLRAPLGVLAVLGNHDHWTDAGAVAGALRHAGIDVLGNVAVTRGPLRIVGIDDAFSGHADVRRSFAGPASGPGATVVISHSPDVIPLLAYERAPLVLVGHTHCGQIVLPNGIAPVANSLLTGKRLYDPRYRCGIVHDPGGRTVVITAGVGSGTVPLRLGAPPDWWLLTLGPRVSPPRP